MLKIEFLLAAVSTLALSSRAADDVRLKGYLGERLDRMIERHVIGTDVGYLVAPFAEKVGKSGWKTEFWGKYMHSAVPFLAYSESDRLRRAIDRGVDRILSSQEPCGYIGDYSESFRCGEEWDVWGIKYTMMGLMHYYDQVKARGEGERRSDQVLSATKRLCDYVIEQLGPNGKRGRELWQTGNWSGYASSSILEPVVWLYRRTHERKYLDFAAYIVKGMTEPVSGPRLVDLALKGVSVADRNGHGQKRDPETAGKYVCKYGRGKAYEMMSCYQGILDYVEEKVKIEGECEQWKDLRLAAIRTAEDIAREEVNLAGGCASSEAWFHGARKQHLPYMHLQETCVTTTWLRFCEKLLDMTGDPKWADEMERTFYNAYLAALKPGEDRFASYTPLNGNRLSGQDHCAMHMNCCNANGPRGFLCFLDEFFRRQDDVATFNFYGSANVNGFEMYSLYPRDRTVRIRSHVEGPLKLRLRIPAWSRKTTVKVKGEEVADVRNGTYLVIDRTWALGDTVALEFDMPVVAHVLDRHVAFTRGPVLLARDSRFSDGDLTESLHWTPSDGETVAAFEEVRVPSSEFWMAFSATLPVGSHSENPEGRRPKTVRFCDFASAGNRWEDDCYYRTWFPLEREPENR